MPNYYILLRQLHYLAAVQLVRAIGQLVKIVADDWSASSDVRNLSAWQM
jgi:hypothetical protein